MRHPERPKQIFLDIGIECNLHCIQCHMHKLSNPSNELSLETKKDIICQIGEWSPHINLVFTGGEPFIRKEHLYSLARTAADCGIYSTVNTNATLLNANDIEYLPHSGINDLVVSIDSHMAEIHDRIRGKKGTHALAINNLKSLVKERNKNENNFHVLVSIILGSHNIRDIADLILFLGELELDNVLIQPIQPIFTDTYRDDWWQTNPLFPMNEEDIDYGIDSLIDLKNKGYRLYQSVGQFELMREYFKNPQKIRSGLCSAWCNTLMINIIGDIGYCFNMERIGQEPIGNIKDLSLKESWFGHDNIRQKMQECNMCCSLMLCHNGDINV